MGSEIKRIPQEEIVASLKRQTQHNLYEIKDEISFTADSTTAIPAAVLVPLFFKQDGWHLLFTRRNSNLPEHSGQVSFPGGRSDQLDQNAVDTALREASEEIGLNPEDVTILGILPELHTITNYRVRPVVGVIPFPYTFVPSPEEVSRVFSIPLHWLADPSNYHIHYRNVPDLNTPLSIIYFNEYDGELLWGVSARLVVTFVQILTSGT